MQMAAREAIARLRDALPSMKARRYRYLPCHVPYTCHYAFACARGEQDEAIEMLVEYLKALEAAFDNLMDDLWLLVWTQFRAVSPTGGSSSIQRHHCRTSRLQHLTRLPS